MTGKSNLRVPSSGEARENGRKGGLASAKARRAAKVYADVAKVLFASKFKTEYAGEDLREFCMGFGLGETETGALMMALSDFMRALREGNSESIERPLFATGLAQSAPQSEKPPALLRVAQNMRGSFTRCTLRGKLPVRADALAVEIGEKAHGGIDGTAVEGVAVV